MRRILVLVSLAACTHSPSSSEIDPDAPTAASSDSDVDTDMLDGNVHVHGYVGAYKSPSIVREGTTFHAYFAADRVAGAHRNIPHATFTADGNWTFVSDALPHLGAQADDGPGGYPVWAPAAAQIDATHWMLYYTAQLTGTEAKKCIWRAHAATADGPFVDDYAGPIFCAPGSLWVIDPYLVKDAHDHWHLAARVDQPGGINTIQIRELGPLGAQFADGSSWIELTHNAPGTWEQPVLENAGVVRIAPPTGEPHWFVFYSGGAWDNNTYGVGYADCGTSIDGPCTKMTPSTAWMGTDGAHGVFGPGTPTFYPSGQGDLLMSVQAWQFSGGQANPNNADGQIMRTYKMTVDDNYVPHAALVRIDL